MRLILVDCGYVPVSVPNASRRPAMRIAFLFLVCEGIQWYKGAYVEVFETHRQFVMPMWPSAILLPNLVYNRSSTPMVAPSPVFYQRRNTPREARYEPPGEERLDQGVGYSHYISVLHGSLDAMVPGNAHESRPRSAQFGGRSVSPLPLACQ
jgi:hypothetical protein